MTFHAAGCQLSTGKSWLLETSGRRGTLPLYKLWFLNSSPYRAAGQSSLQKTHNNLANNFMCLFPNQFFQSYQVTKLDLNFAGKKSYRPTALNPELPSLLDLAPHLNGLQLKSHWNSVELGDKLWVYSSIKTNNYVIRYTHMDFMFFKKRILNGYDYL